MNDVPADDRGFLYGDGLFETMLAIDGQIPCLELHRDRLEEGAQRLRIPCSWSPIEAQLTATTPLHGDFVIRVTLSRGTGHRGYAPRGCEPRVRIRCNAFSFDPRAPARDAKLGVTQVCLSEQPALAGIKHCNRLEQVLAAMDATDQGVDDVLMLNGRGHVQCTGTANVFALKGEVLSTPDCKRCGIAGTRRRLLREVLVPELGWTYQETQIPLEALYDADAVFTTNAITGLRRVASIGSHEFAQSPSLALIQKAYYDYLHACIAR